MKRSLSFACLLALALGACSGPETAENHDAHQHRHHTDVPAAATGHLTDMSLYNLETDWADQRGERLQLSRLQGKVQLVAMVYTSCTYACPRIVADLKRIEAALQQYGNEEVGIVLVTLDPARDTPEQLQEFAAENKLDARRWTLLTSDEANIQELAALLNIKYKKESNGDIAHSNIISVLNQQGEVVHQQEGLGTDPDETVKSIEGLLQRM